MNKKIIAGIILLILAPFWAGIMALLSINQNTGLVFWLWMFAPAIIGVTLLVSAKFKKTTVEVSGENQALALTGRVIKAFSFFVALIITLLIISDISSWWNGLVSFQTDVLFTTLLGIIALLYSF